MLLSWPAKIAVLLLFFGYLAVSIVGELIKSPIVVCTDCRSTTMATYTTPPSSSRHVHDLATHRFNYRAAICAGLGKVDHGQPVEDLCPDGSYVIPFERLNTATFDTQVGPLPDQTHY